MRTGAVARKDGRVDPVEDARALVSERFPAALAAFLGGGVLSSRRTVTSDLDIVVVLAGPPAPYRESLRWRGWPTETFVHDRDSLDLFFAKDAARRRPSLARMCTGGVILADAGVAAEVRERAQAVLAAGPPAASDTDLNEHRYGLTDLVDDLAGSTDPAETAVIGWNVWVATAELALIQAGAWLGSGKWLPRELRASDPDLAARMVAAIGDRRQLIDLAEEVLDRAGGRFWVGYRVPAP
jgi:hypothetical protein